MHYNRWHRHGEPGEAEPRVSHRPTTFWPRVDQSGPGGCWIWTGLVDKRGYGRIGNGGRTLAAHRYAYELLVGVIPDGLEIDHLCKVTSCVNPDHLEPVTRRENLARSSNPAGIAIRTDCCIRGHAFTPENTYRRPSRPKVRQCRICKRATDRAARKSKKEAPLAAALAARS